MHCHLDSSSNHRQWYVGICIANSDDEMYTVNHLEHCNNIGDDSPS